MKTIKINTPDTKGKLFLRDYFVVNEECWNFLTTHFTAGNCKYIYF
jgi:hypothetical protein